MKKFLKSVAGLASVAAVAAGVYYVTKKWMDEKDELLEDDFELDDGEKDSREYVTLDLDNEEEASSDEEEAEEEESTEEEAETEESAEEDTEE